MNSPADPSEKPEDEVTESFDSMADGSDPGIFQEFIWFVKYNKKWWLTPILVVFLLLVVLAFLTNSPAAPFIYTLF